MDRTELLAAIEQAAAANTITRQEVVAAYDKGSGHTTPASQKLTIANVLYYIGGAIVFLGIAVLISQNWSQLNDVTKIVSTLGAAVAAYLVAVLLGSKPKFVPVSYAFFLISALVLPIGIYVAFEVANITFTIGIHAVIAAILLAVHGASFLLFRKTIFLIFTLIFGAWLFFALTSYLVGNRPLFDAGDFIAYRFLCVGLMYTFFGYHLTTTKHRELTGPLYSFGLAIFLGAALALGKWQPQQNTFWELIFPGLVFGIIFLSVHLKSKAFLTFGALYLMAYIIKITGEYFTDSLGWPLALVLAGFALIAIGYFSVYLNRRYITAKTTQPALPL